MVTAETLNYISRQLDIFWGSFMFILGIIGALWNILIFRHYSLATSSYCTYLLIASVVSCIHLLFSLPSRIIEDSLGIDSTANSIVWCKIRSYMTQWTSLTVLSCLVFSALDRFFSTCRQIRWRRLNSIHTAKQICLFSSLFWMIINIPTLVYVRPIQITTTKRSCQSSSLIWSYVLTFFFNICCYGIFPWVFMSLFGCLTWKKIRHIRHHRIGTETVGYLSRRTRIDDQLASMLFLQMIICFVSSILFCTYSIYQSLTQTIEKNEYLQAQEYLFFQISHLIFYLNYVSMFYVNYLSSAIFRHIAKDVLINSCKKQEDISRNITVVNHQDNNNTQLERQRLNVFNIQRFPHMSRI